DAARNPAEEPARAEERHHRCKPGGEHRVAPHRRHRAIDGRGPVDDGREVRAQHGALRRRALDELAPAHLELAHMVHGLIAVRSRCSSDSVAAKARGFSLTTVRSHNHAASARAKKNTATHTVARSRFASLTEMITAVAPNAMPNRTRIKTATPPIRVTA